MNYHFLVSKAETVVGLLLLLVAVVVVTPWLSNDLASKCNGLVSKLEDTEATVCKPDKWLLLGYILSRNLRLSFKKFWKEIR